MTRSGALRGASCCAIERTGLYVAIVASRRRMVTDCNYYVCEREMLSHVRLLFAVQRMSLGPSVGPAGTDKLCGRCSVRIVISKSSKTCFGLWLGAC